MRIVPSDPDVPRPAILLTGSPASGKSTLGLALARELDAFLVDLDTATAPMLAVVSSLVDVHDLDDGRLAALTRDARYETVVALAEENLRTGRPAVLVAPFTKERRDPQARADLDRRLRAAGGSPVLVWVAVSPETVLARLTARGAERDLAKIADPTDFLRSLEVDAPVGPHVSVDGERPVDEVLAAVLSALA